MKINNFLQSFKRVYFYKFNIILILTVLICFFNTSLLSGSGKDRLDLARSYYNNGEYYNAITEIMRYQYLYPDGDLFPAGMLLLGYSYLNGENYFKTINTFNECYEKYRDSPEGDIALYMIGFTRMTRGAPYYAYRTYMEYNLKYENGIMKEDVSRDLCYNYILLGDLLKAETAINEYSITYTAGKYLAELQELQTLINDEGKKPKKKLWVALLGSVFIPGFSSFYVNDYATGVFSFISNALCIGLFYDAYRDKDRLRMVLFGYVEYLFYSYSLFSSFRNVYEYNANESFYKKVTLKASKKF